jgi:hypothetical protein
MLNNDRKIGLIEETAHNPPYGPGSIRMLAAVKRQKGDWDYEFASSSSANFRQLIRRRVSGVPGAMCS